MSFIRRVLPTLVAGTALGAVFYVIGGAGAAYVPGVSAAAYGAIGFLCGSGAGLSKALQEDKEDEEK